MVVNASQIATAEALLYGVLLLQKKIRRTATIER
jgi:NADH:ubiquinone oxidoreductase subunit B-like Fe-S oxidoreductase